MKFIHLYSFFVVLLSFCSCKKDPYVSPSDTRSNDNLYDTANGTLRIKINGVDWAGGISTSINNDRFSIHARRSKVVSGVSVPWESFSIYLLKKNLLKQRIFKRDSLLNINPQVSKTCSSFNTAQDDGDVLCSYYDIIEEDSLNNYIEITHQVNNYEEVWGNVRVLLKMNITCPSNSHKDTLMFSEGKFHVILKK